MNKRFLQCFHQYDADLGAVCMSVCVRVCVCVRAPVFVCASSTTQQCWPSAHVFIITLKGSGINTFFVETLPESLPVKSQTIMS